MKYNENTTGIPITNIYIDIMYIIDMRYYILYTEVCFVCIVTNNLYIKYEVCCINIVATLYYIHYILYILTL